MFFTRSVAFWGTPFDPSYARGLHHDQLLCAQPALSPTILSATRTIIECFMRAAHLICRLADFFSFFVVSSQRLQKYSRSPHLNLLNLDSSAHLCFYACTRPRPCAMGDGYQGSDAQTLANCSEKLYGLWPSKGKTRNFFTCILQCWDFFPIFFTCIHNAGIRTQLDIIYIILQHISIFLIQEIGPEVCCWVRYALETYLA